MKKIWIRLTLACFMIAICTTVLAKVVEASETTFNGTYEQGMSFFWDTDGNRITFNSSTNTFSMSLNMYEGFHQLTGKYIVKSNQAFCTITSKAFKGISFTMTDINGNLIFQSDERLVTIASGALFKNINNATKTLALPWESAYMDAIKALKQENNLFQFSLYDIDGDGIPELFLSPRDNYTVYTYKNGKAVNIGEVDGGLQLYKSEEKNSILACGGFGTGAGGGMLYTMQNGMLSVGKTVFYYDWPYEAQNGKFYIKDKEVSTSEYDLLVKKSMDFANKIYDIYGDKYVYIPKETRLQDYVTMGSGKAAKQEINVVLNGIPITFDQPPISKDGRTLVPIRKIFESMGATVNWDNSTQTLTGIKNNKVVSLTIGSNKAKIGNNIYYLDVKAEAINGRTLAPVRFIAESFDAYVYWNDATKTVEITDNHEAYSIARVKAYTTDINMDIIESFNSNKTILNESVIKELNNSNFFNETKKYKELINSEMYVASTFKDYLHKSPAARVSLGLGGLTFGDEASDYIVGKWPEKEKYKEMLKSYIKDTQSHFEAVGYAEEVASFADSFLKSVVDIAPAGKYSNISKLFSKLKSGNLSIEELSATSTELLNQIESAAKIEQKLDTITIGGKLTTALGHAGKIIKIANTAIDSIEDVIFATSAVGMYENYINIFETIENDNGTVPTALKAAAKELKEEMSQNYASLIRGISQNVAKLIVDDAVDASKLLSSGVLSSVSAGLNIGTFIGNIGLGMDDAIDGATYTEGYAYLSESFAKRLEQEKQNFKSNYAKSYENTLNSANTFKKDYEALRTLRIAGETAYLKMTGYDTALLKKELRSWTDFDAKKNFCKESLERLNSLEFK